MGTSRTTINTAGIILSIWGLCCLLIPGNSQAISVSWDDVIYEAGADTSVYGANIDMMLLEGNHTLTVKLQNTSTGGAGDSAWNLLSGLGFDLPSGISITGGTAVVGPDSTGWYRRGQRTYAVYEGYNVSGEWGWGQGIGQFNTVVPGLVDWDISCMEASTSSRFSNTPVAPPSVLDGPEFGLLSGLLPASAAGGLNYIQDAVTFQLTLGGDLTGWTSDSLVKWINDHDVIIAFGSPNTIPDASSLLLLGSACLLGFAVLGRKVRA